MSLNKPAFESQESTDVTAAAAADTAAAPAAPAAPAPAPAPAASTEVATKSVGGALAAPITGSLSAGELLAQADHLGTLSDKLRVTWEDFDTVNATQGQFQAKGDKIMLGDTITVRAVSTQPLWVSSNGDTEAEGDGLMLYSNDGVNASEDSPVYDVHVDWLRSKGIEDRDHLTIKEHQAWLKENEHDKAHVQHKLIIVGELVKCGEQGLDLVGNLIQVSLPDTGRRAYESHRKQSAYHISQGRMNATDVEYIKLTAKQAGSGKRVFTQVKIGYAEGHGVKSA